MAKETVTKRTVTASDDAYTPTVETVETYDRYDRHDDSDVYTDRTTVREREYVDTTRSECGNRCFMWILFGIIATLALMAFAYMMGQSRGHEMARDDIARQIPAYRTNVVVPEVDGVVRPSVDRR